MLAQFYIGQSSTFGLNGRREGKEILWTSIFYLSFARLPGQNFQKPFGESFINRPLRNLRRVGAGRHGALRRWRLSVYLSYWPDCLVSHPCGPPLSTFLTCFVFSALWLFPLIRRASSSLNSLRRAKLMLRPCWAGALR